MFSHRLFNIFIAIVLVVALGLTVHDVFATTAIVSSTNSSQEACDTLPSHYSIFAKYSKETMTWVTYTEEAPTGVDGGLIYLLSTKQACNH